ncbi:hypothetical protein NESM_000678100 [Novymonas esmeraldas]|uniref:Tectonic-1-3 N-terminal domain-containing protein n=1 Tax=Novymonas esmeraldas TaxID=1808958 RepID=A0AAW0EUQ0_9TRYP
MMRGLLFLLLLSTCASAYPATVFPVDWTSVPTSTPAARNLDSPYLGECVCDVTHGVCDPFCCCDVDCDATAKASFSYCLPERYSSPYLDYCYPKDQATSLRRINNIDATYIDKKIQGYNAVCVMRTNHPSELYRYFRVPTSVQRPSLPAATATPLAPRQPYAVGDPLTTAKLTLVSGTESYRRVGPFQLPATAADGSCGAVGRGFGYLQAIKGVACTLSGAQMCARFPVARYEHLFVQHALGYDSASPIFVPITVNLHSSAGVLLETLNPADLTVSTTHATYADATTCYNAVVVVQAHFSHSATETGTVAAAVLNITLGNVGLTQYGALSFSAAFTSEGASVPSSIFAATPGYLSGDKVRAGTFTSSEGKSAILERESGFAVPAGGRLCSSASWKRAHFLYSIVSSGCLVATSESELQTLCSAGTGNLISSLINVTVDGVSTVLDRVAVTNDALVNDTTSWIEVSGLSDALSSTAGTYNTYTRQCVDVVVGLHYQFVIARAGAEYNPQDIIVGAFASPTRGTLQIWNETDFSGNALSYQQISFKVSFVRYDPNSQATIMRRVVAPPILPRLDDSIFYPFRRPYPL